MRNETRLVPCRDAFAVMQPQLYFRGREWFGTLATEEGAVCVRVVPLTSGGRLTLDLIANAHGVNTRDMAMAWEGGSHAE